jgi:hypothetical protein
MKFCIKTLHLNRHIEKLKEMSRNTSTVRTHSGNYIYHQLCQLDVPRFAHKLELYVSCDSHNKGYIIYMNIKSQKIINFKCSTL